MNRKKEERLDEELRFHLEAEARERRGEGASGVEAHLAARRDLGNVGLIKDAAREVWGWTSLQRLTQDARYGLRMMRRSPGLSALAVASLAIGIGANTTVYSIVRAVMTPPAGVREPERVLNVHRREPGGTRLLSVNYPDWLALRDGNTAFSIMSAWTEAPVSLNAGEAAERAESLLVAGGFFETLGLKPSAGRFFDGKEESDAVAVVSHRFWRRHPEALGGIVRINGHPFTVVGVTPAGFTSPYPVFAPDLFVPLRRKEQVRPGFRLDDPGAQYLKLVGRLKPGVSRQAAEASLPALPDTQGRQPRVLALAPAGEFPDDIRLPGLGAAAFLFAIAGFVLAIACANVGSLLLARATARRAEIGVRIAIGAGRGRIVRQLVTECVLLFLPAALGGVALSASASAAIRRLQAPLRLPFQLEPSIDYRVLVFTLVLALGAGVVFGLAPAAQALRAAVLPYLKETGGPGRSRLRNAFLVCEFSLAFVLVMALGIFVEAARRGSAVYPGKDPSRLYLVDLDLGTLGYSDGRRAAIFDRIAAETGELPGVESVALAAAVPIGWEFMRSTMETLDGQMLQPDINRVSPGYFRTAGIALLRGRDFTAADRGGASVAVVVNETMARTVWPGQDPIGKRLRRHHPGHYLEVVGVAADTRQSLWAGPVPLFVYVPAAESVPDSLVLHVRPRGEPGATLAAIREIVRRADPNIPLPTAASLEDRIRFVMLPHRLAAALAGAFGGLGLLLAALGIYGVTAYSVAQRTREIGVRMALGADPAQLWRSFAVEGTRLITGALAVSLALSYGIVLILEDALYGVPALNLRMLGAAAAAFAVAWVGGIYLPARRAIAVDPSRALRWE